MRQLDFIGQFTPNIQYIKEKNNISAGFMFKIESIRFLDTADYKKLKEYQDNKKDLSICLNQVQLLV